MGKNTVEIIGHYGSDEVIACSAWTSTSRTLTDEKRNRIPKLIKDLWDNNHGTPFEKGTVHFLVNSDIASHIHMLKHRISSINAECLTGDTLITFVNKNGVCSSKRKIKDVYQIYQEGRSHQKTDKDSEYSKKRIKQLRIRVLNEDTKIFEYSHIKHIWKTDIKKIYKITLRNGKFIECSDNHPLYTKDGYKSVNDGLVIGELIGCNGIKLNVKGKPHTFVDFFKDASDYTRKEFAVKNNCKYELIKKWGYIYDIVFKVDENKDFKKGNMPWNDGKAGTYKIDIGNRKHNPRKGEDCHFWRGGITDERDAIGTWTSNQSKHVHKKYNYTCQECGNNHSELDAHHIIPVAQDISKAYEFDNLITLCKPCHNKIHVSLESEQTFAEKVLTDTFEPFVYDYRNVNRINNLRSVHYSDIVSIEYIKDEECYDIEVKGTNKNFVANGIVCHNSARYKELKENKLYLPQDWNGIEISEDGQYISTNGEDAWEFDKGDSWLDTLKEYTEFGNLLYHQCLKDLTPVLGRKRAKESARFFKTYNSQIECDIMFNMRSFHNFLTQRMDSHAQLEIQEIAKQMLELVKGIEGNPFKHTLEAWNM